MDLSEKSTGVPTSINCGSSVSVSRDSVTMSQHANAAVRAVTTHTDTGRETNVATQELAVCYRTETTNKYDQHKQKTQLSHHESSLTLILHRLTGGVHWCFGGVLIY